MSLVHKLKNAGLWQSFQTGMQIVAQFGYTAIMARLLSKSDFGLMALAGSFIAFGTLFGEAGMGAALIQRKTLSKHHHSAAFQGSIISGLTIFLIFFFSAGVISSFFHQPDLEMIIKVVGVTIILSSVNSISVSLLQKEFRFKQTSLVLTVNTLIGYGTGIFLGFKSWGVWSLVAATVITSLLNTIVLLSLAPVKVSFRFRLKEWKDLFSFGSGIILLKINNYLGSQGLNLVLGRTFLPAQLGVFERAGQIKNLPGGYIGNVLDTVMFPAMSEIQDQKERLFKIYQHALGIVNTILIPVSVYLIIFAKEVVLILLGDRWSDAVLPLQIMFIVLPFSASGRMADSIIRARGLIYKNVKRKSLFIVVLFTLVLIGGHFYGVAGAAAGVTLSHLFNYCIMLLLVKKIFGKKIAEIFLHPVLSGVNLTVIVLLTTAFYSVVFYTWAGQPVLKFLVISFLVIVTLLISAYKRPSILGVYLRYLVEEFFKKKSLGSTKISGRVSDPDLKGNFQYAEPA